MSNDRDLSGDFHAMLEDALLPAPPPHTVEVDTERGREILFYSSDEDGQVCDGGTLIIPADTPENRRRAVITGGCHLCPDVNQGLMSQEHDLGPEVGTHIIARYQECGHGTALRLDEEGPLTLWAEA
ncbi:hypothetical protein [Streptomyces scabiei]|uniref:hypothetical protein n=1 Tax=Streptomyces scabiei TaxID=1930 RepID=UPI001B33614D|nr:hypothetical protein [Streptomyces sp. LBUM 1479]